jgi:hypothetical protein
VTERKGERANMVKPKLSKEIKKGKFKKWRTDLTTPNDKRERED